MPHGLLRLGQVGHRVTLMWKRSEVTCRSQGLNHTHTRARAHTDRCLPKDTVMPLWESSLTTDWLCSSSGASVTMATLSRLP